MLREHEVHGSSRSANHQRDKGKDARPDFRTVPALSHSRMGVTGRLRFYNSFSGTSKCTSWRPDFTQRSIDLHELREYPSSKSQSTWLGASSNARRGSANSASRSPASAAGWFGLSGSPIRCESFRFVGIRASTAQEIAWTLRNKFPNESEETFLNRPLWWWEIKRSWARILIPFICTGGRS